MTRLLLDTRHAVRQLRATSTSAAVIVVVVAVGVSIVMTVWGLVGRVLLRSTPYRNPAEVVVIREEADPRVARSPQDDERPTLDDLRSRGDLFVAVAGLGGYREFRVTVGGVTRVLVAAEVSDEFVDVLGFPMRPAGSEWTARRDAEEPIVLLADGRTAWLGAQARPMSLIDTNDGGALRVAAVLPAAFVFPHADAGSSLRVDALVPSAAEGRRYRRMVARLRPGVSIAGAEAALESLYAATPRYRPLVTPIGSYLHARLWPVAVGAFSAALLLIIVCAANVADLALARTAGQRANTSIRRALGASTAALWRLHLAAYGILGFVGAAVGAMLAGAVLLVVPGIVPLDYLVAGPPSITVDALTAGAMATLLMMAPATVITGNRLARVTSPGAEPSRPMAPVWRARVLRQASVLVQWSIAVTMLALAGHLIRSYVVLVRQDPGLAPDAVVASVSPSPTASRLEAVDSLRAVRAGLRDLPLAVQAAAGIGSMIDGTIAVANVEIAGNVTRVSAKFVTDGYFAALGAALRRGRAFAPGDSGAVIVSESLAEGLWPNQEAVGRLFATSRPTTLSGTVIGVAPDTFDYALDVRPRHTVYLHIERASISLANPFHYVVRFQRLLPGAQQRVREAIERASPDAAVGDVATVTARFLHSIRDRRFVTLASALFAVVAAAVSVAGLTAVVGVSVARRTNELAVRIALGASPGDVRWLVIRDTVAIALVGLGVGLASAAWMSNGMTSYLYGVEPADPLSLAVAASAALTLGVVASLAPAAKAVSISPASLLRGS